MKPKRSIREWFVGVLAGGILTPKKGCDRVRVVITDDAVYEEKLPRESGRVLAANIGTCLMLFHGDEIAKVQVTAIRVDGWNERLTVTPLAYCVSDGPVAVLKVAA